MVPYVLLSCSRPCPFLPSLLSLFLSSYFPTFLRPCPLPCIPSLRPSFHPSLPPSFLPSFQPSVFPCFRPSSSFLPSIYPWINSVRPSVRPSMWYDLTRISYGMLFRLPGTVRSRSSLRSWFGAGRRYRLCRQCSRFHQTTGPYTGSPVDLQNRELINVT